MVKFASTPAIAPVPPNSRMFNRGSLGDDLDGRSKEGKFLRRCESELARHVGGNPNFPQRLLIRRAARAMLRLELFDTKMVKGNFTTHDAHVYGGLSNTLRLCLRELGIKSQPAKPVTLNDIAARHKQHAAAP